MILNKSTRIVLAACITSLVLFGCDLFGNGSTVGYGTIFEFEEVQTIIGRGYDVFEDYANPESIRSSILDYSKLIEKEEIEKTRIDRTEYRTVSGTSISSFQKEWGVSASLSGDFPFFSGSVASSFSTTTTGNSENQYATIQANVRKNQYALKNKLDVSMLKSYLTDSFRADINDTSMSSDDLFIKYGTHVMVAVVLGARYDYTLAAQKTDMSSNTEISGYAQTSFNSITTEGGFNIENVDINAFSTTETKVKAVGGESSLAAGTAAAFTDWKNSITDDTVAFSDFAQNGLIPIWEFCDDAGRRATIETAYADWGQRKYDQYISKPSPIPTGKVTFSLETFDNNNVGDKWSTAEWLYKVVLSSDADNTDHRLSRARTSKEDAIDCGKKQSLTFHTLYSYTVPQNSTNTFQILPLLEECDGDDLGISDSGNDRYCTALSGPRFNFALNGSGELMFTGVDTGQYHYSEGYFSFDSGGLSNSSLSMSLGQSKTFYLVLKQFNRESSSEWVQFKMKVSWKEK